MKPSLIAKDINVRVFHFDDLTDTILLASSAPTGLVLCLYFMGLNLSNEQIAQELDWMMRTR